jgi:hypothetical protein
VTLKHKSQAGTKAMCDSHDTQGLQGSTEGTADGGWRLSATCHSDATACPQALENANHSNIKKYPAIIELPPAP